MGYRYRTSRRALLKDADLLLQANILKGSRRAATDRLRQILGRGAAFLLGDRSCLEPAGKASDRLETGPDLLLRSADREGPAKGAELPPDALSLMLWWLETDSAGRTARLQLKVKAADEKILQGNFEPDPDGVVRLAGQIHDLFTERGFHRLEWSIPADQLLLQKLAARLGFVREGCLRGAVAADFFYQDAYLYGLLAPEDPVARTAFVHFGWFLLELYGDDRSLKRVEIRPFGSVPSGHVSREALAHLNLLNEEGRVSLACCPALSGPGDRLVAGPAWPAMLAQAAAELSTYIKGGRADFKTRLDPAAGTDFQRAVWEAIRTVPYGSVLTYEELAERLLAGLQPEGGQREAETYARAVGGACAANPFLIFVPCHRIVGKGGRLTGFRGGVENKARLLDFEIMALKPPGQTDQSSAADCSAGTD